MKAITRGFSLSHLLSVPGPLSWKEMGKIIWESKIHQILSVNIASLEGVCLPMVKQKQTKILTVLKASHSRDFLRGGEPPGNWKEVRVSALPPSSPWPLGSAQLCCSTGHDPQSSVSAPLLWGGVSGSAGISYSPQGLELLVTWLGTLHHFLFPSCGWCTLWSNAPGGSVWWLGHQETLWRRASFYFTTVCCS